MSVSKKKLKEIEKRLDKLETLQTEYSWDLGKKINFPELVRRLPEIIKQVTNNK